MFIGFYEQIYSVHQLLLSLKIVCNIARKGILFLRVLPFDVQLDFLSEKIVSHISRKDIWLLHELPFGVEQFHSSYLTDGCNICKGT